MNRGVRVSFQISFLFSSDKYPEGELLGGMEALFLFCFIFKFYFIYSFIDLIFIVFFPITF